MEEKTIAIDLPLQRTSKSHYLTNFQRTGEIHNSEVKEESGKIELFYEHCQIVNTPLSNNEKNFSSKNESGNISVTINNEDKQGKNAISSCHSGNNKLTIDKNGSEFVKYVIDSASDITDLQDGGILKQILKHGFGDEKPAYGDIIKCHYSLWLLNNPTQPQFLESSYGKNISEVQLGKDMVFSGWDISIASMKKEEKSIFIIAPQYAFGKLGKTPFIPPETPFLVEIEVLDWSLDDLSAQKNGSIHRKVLKKGKDGAIFPTEGGNVKIHLIQYLNDKVVQASEKEFILGEGVFVNVPLGIEIALAKFRENETSMVYLKNKTPSRDHSNVTTFKVTLLHAEKIKELWEMTFEEKLEKSKFAKERGLLLLKDGHFKQAATKFALIIKYLKKETGILDKSEEERKQFILAAYLNMAFCYIKMNMYADVINVCNKVISTDPVNEKAFYRRGYARMMNSEFSEALDDFCKVCALNVTNKLAAKHIHFCQQKVKEQKEKDKNTYAYMFEKFKKQDEANVKNFSLETGVWESESNEILDTHYTSETEKLIAESNAVLNSANIIQLYNPDICTT